MSTEKIQSIVNKGDELIIHIGKDNIPSTRFTVYSKSLALEVRDALNEFLGDNNATRRSAKRRH